MKEIFVTGTGFWKPNEIVTNDEIVNSCFKDLIISDLKHEALIYNQKG